MTKKKAGKAPAKRPRRAKPRVKNTVDNSVVGSIDAAGATQAPPTREGANGGELRSGNPGNKGGTGRPRNEARELALAGYMENLPRLVRIAAGTETVTIAVNTEAGPIPVQVQPTVKESIQAMAELGKIGVGTKVEIDTPSLPVAFGFLVAPEVAQEAGG